MAEHMEEMEAGADGPPKTFMQRVMSWAGRMHPFAVHFPIALYPVALVALFLARRRGERVELIRALIIVAGAGSVGAALLGWLLTGLPASDPDAIHVWHRWIGTGLAFAGAAVAMWAWKRRDSVDSSLMLGALGTITVALLVQGWLGAVLVRGMNHMIF